MHVMDSSNDHSGKILALMHHVAIHAAPQRGSTTIFIRIPCLFGNKDNVTPVLVYKQLVIVSGS